MTGRLLLQLAAFFLIFSSSFDRSDGVELNETDVARLWRFLRGNARGGGADRKADDARSPRIREDQVSSPASTAKAASVPGRDGKLAALLKTIMEPEDNSVAQPPQKETTERSRSSSRQHKAFFVNYPVVQRVYKDLNAKVTSSPVPRKKQKLNKKRKPKPDSDIYVIKLPPAPYNYIPGLGYISQPPSFSLTRKKVKPKPQHPQNPFIKLPTKFVSNGKPTSVYKWPSDLADDEENGDNLAGGKRPQYQDSPVIRLNRGPYLFNGKPMSMYVIKRRNQSPNSYGF